MKRLLFVFAVLCVVGYAVYAYAWTAGRDLQPVSDGSGSLTVDGSVTVSGTVTATLSDKSVYDTQLEQFKFTGDDLKMVFSNATLGVTGTFWQTTQPISGTVTATPSGTQAVSNQALTDAQDDDTGIYVKQSSANWWTVTRVVTDVVTPDSAYTVTIKAASADHAYRVTGISMAVWCFVTYELLIDDSVVYVGGCLDALNFAFPTPIKAGLNESIKLRFTLVKDTADCKVWFTIIGDE